MECQARHEIGITQLHAQRLEHGVYARGTRDAQLIVGIYVDDLIITGVEQHDMRCFKEEMKQLFSMSNLKVLHHSLEVNQERRRMYNHPGRLCQQAAQMSGHGGLQRHTHPDEGPLQQQGEQGEASGHEVLPQCHR